MDTQTIYRRRWIILSVLIVGLLAIVLDNTVLNVALKTIAEPRGGLGASQSQLEWAINSYTLVFAGLLFTFGVIGDRIGRKRMLMIGLVLFGLSSLLSAYSRTPDQLIFARAAMGLGGAAVMPQTLSIISNVFEPGERPRAIGIWATAVGIAIAIGPIVGGAAARPLLVGLGLPDQRPDRPCRRIAAAVLVPESRNPRPAGSTTSACCCPSPAWCCSSTASSRAATSAPGCSPSVLGPIVGGLAVLALFAWFETRIAHPSLDVRLFRDPRLSAAVGAIALVFFAMGGVFFFTSFYMQNVRGYSPLNAGLLTVPLAAGQLLLSPRSAAPGQAVRRQGGGRRPGLFVMAAAVAGYATLGTTTPDLAPRRAVRDPGRGDRASSCRRPPPRSWPWCRASGPGPGSALTNTARQVAVALGVAVLGSILAEAYRNPLSPVPGRPAGRGAGHGLPVDHRHPGGRAAARPGRTALLGPANDAFVHAMHITALVAAVVALVGGFVAALDARPPAAGAGNHRRQ